MSNSPLVNFTRISPHKNSPRNHVIDTITIHCVVGQASVESLGATFAAESRKASANYGVGFDGRIGMFVEEKDRSWCSSSRENDNRAITIEVASDTEYPYAVKDAAYKSLIDLLVDICKRNNIKQLLWKNDKSLIGQVDKQNMTVHRWFASTECPGEYLYSRMGAIANAVNARLGVSEIIEDAKQEEKPKDDISDVNEKAPFKITVKNPDLEIWKGPGVKYEKTNRKTGKGVFTIVDVKDGWGKLKSGMGWVPLSLVNPTEDKTPENETENEQVEQKPATQFAPYAVKVNIPNLNIRKGPGSNYDKTGRFTGVGVFTIVDAKPGEGSDTGWGKLKSGMGWVSLDYTEKV